MLSGCGAEDPPPTRAAPSASAARLDLEGMPYAQARKRLFAIGLTLVPQDARFGPGPAQHPHSDFPELDGRRAVLFQRLPDGGADFVVIEVDERLLVTQVRSPASIDALPAIPPPFAAGIPNMADQDYAAARRRLLALGFVSKKTWDPASPDHTPPPWVENLPPEVPWCSGSGMAFCAGFWIAPDGRVLKVTTIGEPQPGRIYDMTWATPDDLADLPEGWRD